MVSDTQFKVYVTLRHVDGARHDEESLLDAFCAEIGNQNGAREKSVKIKVGSEWDDNEGTYEVWLVDDRPTGGEA